MTLGQTYWYPLPPGVVQKNWHTLNSIASVTNLVVVSYTVPTGKVFKATFYSICGKLGECRMTLQEKIATVWTDVDAVCTPVASETRVIQFIEPLEFSAGTEIRILARNSHTVSQNVRAIFRGVEL